MESLRKQFERELKAKLSQKSGQFNTEEATLTKAFKYFDLNNDGVCQPQEFEKALSKIGVQIPSKKDLDNLFAYYDKDSSGYLDYKEFTQIIVNGDDGTSSKKNQEYGQGLGYKQQFQSSTGGGNANDLMTKVRAKLASRGARGIIGMGKQFKIFDDNNNRSLDFYEFTKAMKEQMLQLSDSDIKVLFDTFDRNRDGSIDYDEFIRTLRGPMNNFRKKLVGQAYQKLDRDGSGAVDINDLKGVYNATRHPDVISGKKTEEDILLEFLDTFQTHHNICNSQAPDHIVTPEEFMEYYNNISASIDNDQYFELMINNTWKVNEGDRQYGKGWANKDEGGKQQSFGNKPQLKQGGAGAARSTTGGAYGGGFQGASPQKSNNGGSQYGGAGGGLEASLKKMRDRLASRGARGFIGMQKQFKIMDDNNSGTIDMQEFKKAVNDFRLDLNPQEAANVFKYFDRDASGEIDYDEFVRGVRGPMNNFRKNIVMAAFKKIDRDNSGILDLNDIKGVYNAKNHPEVKSGKKTEDEILGEFLETFEMHHSLNGGGVRDRSVTPEEFIEYYNNVSASIDNDQYFELMMINAWKLHGEAPRKPAWTNVAKKDLYKDGGGFSVSQSAPFGTTNQGTDYSTNLRPSSKANPQQYQQMPPAGGTSFPLKTDGTITGNKKAANPQQAMSYSEQQLLEVFREKLANRGARGIIGLARQFKIMDDDQSHDLDLNEFRKAIKDFKVTIMQNDIERLFNIFDRDRSGKISYDELLRGVRGEMNAGRRALCEKAFKIMDKDKSGVLNIDDIRGVYNAKKHPDVIKGKKTEDEVLGEFLDTFEMHYSLNHEGSRDGQISMDEWMEYYNNVSMSIDDDKYFQLMMNSAWNLDGSKVTKKGWGGEI